MTPYIIYSRDNCPWCVKAKELLEMKGLPYNELKLGIDYNREELRAKMGGIDRLTVPQIFHEGNYVGNYEGLRNLIESNQL
jgi:glutaredoxin-related protein